MDKTTVGNLCKPYIGQLKLDDNTLIDYFDIASVDNIEKQITGYTTYKFAEAPSRARKKVEKGNILVSTVRPNLNAVALFDEETENMPVASTGFCVLECKANTSPRFLFRYLQSQSFVRAMVSQATGASYPAVNDKIVRDTKLPAYSYEEQVQIANVLDATANIISKRKQQLQKLDELVKARFVEMFGDFPLNPKGWEITTIRDIVTDVRYGSSRPAVDGGKYPYLRMNNITYGGELDLTDIKRIDIPDNELDKCTVRRGDVLFNRTNSKELVGKTCVYNRDEMMVLAGFVIRVRVTERILPEFLSAFLNTDFSKQMLLGMCKTAIGQANINAQEMQNIEIYLPPTELQRQFVQFKEQADKSKAAAQKALDEAQLLFDSLMQQYFS